jgi:hypothetical protein
MVYNGPQPIVKRMVKLANSTLNVGKVERTELIREFKSNF